MSSVSEGAPVALVESALQCDVLLGLKGHSISSVGMNLL